MVVLFRLAANRKRIVTVANERMRTPQIYIIQKSQNLLL